MAAGAAPAARLIGCFGLTEPDFGSNPGGMVTTRRRRTATATCSTARKMWITNGTVRRRRDRLGQARRRASAASSSRPDTPGFTAPEQKHKYCLRASVTCELVLEDVRVARGRDPARARRASRGRSAA